MAPYAAGWNGSIAPHRCMDSCKQVGPERMSGYAGKNAEVFGRGRGPHHLPVIRPVGQKQTVEIGRTVGRWLAKRLHTVHQICEPSPAAPLWRASDLAAVKAISTSMFAWPEEMVRSGVGYLLGGI